MKHRILSRIMALALLSCAAGLSAAPAGPRVVASTSWTAAFVLAAGAADVTALAPADLRHPAEYELRPSDITAVQKADVLVAAGYETMMKRIQETVARGGTRLVTIGTGYSLATLRSSVLALAAVLGTEEEARRNIRALEEFLSDWKAELARTGTAGAPVVASFHQKPLLEELGFSVIGVFGPGPLEAVQIARLSVLKPAFVVDNWHMELAVPLRETMKGARFASLINFPGVDGTKTLLDVLRANRTRLREAR